MKLVGPLAVQEYLRACPSDDLSHLSAEELAEFEFEDVGIQLISMQWDRALVDSGLSPSRTAARRLIKQGGAKVDGEKITDFSTTEFGEPNQPKNFILSAGKRKVRVVVGDK